MSVLYIHHDVCGAAAAIMEIPPCGLESWTRGAHSCLQNTAASCHHPLQHQWQDRPSDTTANIRRLGPRHNGTWTTILLQPGLMLYYIHALLGCACTLGIRQTSFSCLGSASAAPGPGMHPACARPSSPVCAASSAFLGPSLKIFLVILGAVGVCAKGNCPPASPASSLGSVCADSKTWWSRSDGCDVAAAAVGTAATGMWSPHTILEHEA
jgi:hypothetical protein